MIDSIANGQSVVDQSEGSGFCKVRPAPVGRCFRRRARSRFCPDQAGRTPTFFLGIEFRPIRKQSRQEEMWSPRRHSGFLPTEWSVVNETTRLTSRSLCKIELRQEGLCSESATSSAA